MGVAEDLLNGPTEVLSEEEIALQQRNREIEAKYGGGYVSQQRGILRAMLGPAEDLFGSEQDTPEVAEFNRANDEKHRIANIAGNLAGYLGGALTGVGVPGMLTKAGAHTAKTVAKMGIGGGAVAGKGAGFVAGTAIEGGGIALSEATAESAIDRAMGVPGSGIHLGELAGQGAKIGAGFGLLALALPKAGNFLFRAGFKKRIAQTAKAKKELSNEGEKYNALKAELDDIEAHAIDKYTSLRARRHAEIIGRPGSKPISPVPVRGGKDYIRQPSPGMTEPALATARKKMKAADDKVRKSLTQALDDVGKNTKYGAMDLLVDGALVVSGNPAMAVLRNVMKPTLGNIQHKIFQGITHLKPIRYLMSSSLHAGKLSATKMVRQGSQYVPAPNWGYGKYLDTGKTMASALKVPPIVHMTREEYNDIADEILEADPVEMERGIRMALAAKGLPQETAGPIAEQNVRILSFLASKMPPRHKPKWLAHEGPAYVPTAGLRKFSESMRGAMMPPAAIHDFLAGTLSEETAAAWWATQPEMAKYLAERIKSYIRIAEAHGKVFSPSEKKMLGMMADEAGNLIGRNKSYNLIQYLQSTYSAEEASAPPAQVGGPKPPGDPGAFSGVSQGTTGPSAGLGRRLAGER